MTTGPGLYNYTNMQLAANLKELTLTIVNGHFSFPPMQVILGTN